MPRWAIPFLAGIPLLDLPKGAAMRGCDIAKHMRP